MLRKTIFAAAPLIAMAVISGCGSNDNQDLFKCADVAIANGAQSICEAGGAAFGSGNGAAAYDCVPVSSVVFIADQIGSPGACPPGTAPQAVGSGAGGHAGGTSDGTGPGSSSSGGPPAGSDGTTSSGGSSGTQNGSDGTTSSGSSSGGSSGSQNGSDGTTSGSSSGGSSSGASGGGSSGGGGGGGGYQCTTVGGQTTCVSTACDPGYHKSPCGTCVPASCSSCSCTGALGCSLTQGYWQNHASAWPVASLTLGGTNYSKAQLLAILGQPTRGDASVILAHQLIAAMLNVAKGASDAPIKQVLADAHTWLQANAAGKTIPFGVRSSSAAGADAVALAAKLDAYNNGNSGVPHCD